MSIEYNVLNILKEHSSKEAAITLKVTDIVTYMHREYDKSITDKQVRKALKDLTDSELNLTDTGYMTMSAARQIIIIITL